MRLSASRAEHNDIADIGRSAAAPFRFYGSDEFSSSIHPICHPEFARRAAKDLNLSLFRA
jgi:hypothetical protein